MLIENQHTDLRLSKLVYGLVIRNSVDWLVFDLACFDSIRAQKLMEIWMNRLEASLLKLAQEGSDSSILTFQIPQLDEAPAPGQFFMIKLISRGFPLFGRAFAVLDYTPAGSSSEISFLIKSVGKGTSALISAQPGDKALLVGPAGNHFPSFRKDRPYILIAGGTGIAAFHYLLASLKSKQVGALDEPVLLYGARDHSTIYLKESIDGLGALVKISTEDGSQGEKGLVTRLVESELERTDFSPDTIVYACGPDLMMRAVSRLTLQKNLRTYLSLETRMACGIGVCNGCVIKVVRNSVISYERVCHEGPVFEAKDLPYFCP